jgi:DNA-binding NarL/FixJ family response regulator
VNLFISFQFLFSLLKQAMETPRYLSPSAIAEHEPKQMWKTPVRAAVRSLRRQGKSYNQIVEETSLKQSTI